MPSYRPCGVFFLLLFFCLFVFFKLWYKPSNYQPPTCECSTSILTALLSLKPSLPPLRLVLKKPTRLVQSVRQLFSIPDFVPCHSLWCVSSATGQIMPLQLLLLYLKLLQLKNMWLFHTTQDCYHFD